MRSLDLRERYWLAGKHDRAGDVWPAIPQMDRLASDGSKRTWRCPCSWPRIVTSFVDIVLKLVKRLSCYTGDAVLGRVAALLEVVPYVRACLASTIIGELAGKAPGIGRIPQHPVGGPYMETVRHYRRQPIRQRLRQPVRVELHAS